MYDSIFDKLMSDLKIGRLYNSYLIVTNDIPSVYLELEGFVSSQLNNTRVNGTKSSNIYINETLNKKLNKTHIDSDGIKDNEVISNKLKKDSKNNNFHNSARHVVQNLYHQDYLLIKKEDDKSKNILMDQIKTVQVFLYTTSSKTKFVVICGAEDMNLNVANTCLKILEDTPNNTHIFLITGNLPAIIDTIRSRCNIICVRNDSNVGLQKLDDQRDTKGDNKCSEQEDYVKYLISDAIITTNYITFLSNLQNKDHNIWDAFALNIQQLIIRYWRYVSSDCSVVLSEDELRILQQFKSISSGYIYKKCKAIQSIIDDTLKFDLDLASSAILIIEEFQDSDRDARTV